MFHFFAMRRIRSMFAELSHSNFEPALAGLAPNFEQRFAGDHPLGGVRTDVDTFRRWFERMYRLFPNLEFDVVSTAASGPPWDLTLVAEWVDRATPVDGGDYENRGVHVIRLRWGRSYRSMPISTPRSSRTPATVWLEMATQRPQPP